MQFSFQNHPSQDKNDGRKKDGKDAKEEKERWRQIHHSIPDNEWEFRFKQLLGLNLIDVPDDYFEDKLFFKDPDTLKDMFEKLEEDNLSMIHNQQNQEQNYEKLLITQKNNEEQKQKIFDEQDKTRIDLQIKINQAYGLFAALKKKQ